MEDFLEQRTVNWMAKDAQDSERCGERQIHCGNQGDKRDGAVGTEEERRQMLATEKRMCGRLAFGKLCKPWTIQVAGV